MEVLLQIIGAAVVASGVFIVLGRIAPPHLLVFVAGLLQVVAALLLTMAERGSREGNEDFLIKRKSTTKSQLMKRERKVSQPPTAALADQQDRSESEVEDGTR